MASVSYVVNATDLASAVFAKIAKSADGLDAQLADLSKRVATPEVDLKDAKFTAGLIRVAERIDKLSKMMAEPGVDLSDTKFQAEILKINAQLDRLDGRRVTATVKVDVDRSFMSRLRGMFGGGGGGAAGGAAAGGGFAGLIRGLPGAAGAAPPAAQAVGIGAAIAAALALGPALLPTLLGGGVGALGAAGGIAVGAKDRAQLLALQKQLAGVTGSTASANARRGVLQGQISAFRQGHGPQLAFGQAASGLLPTLEGTFFGALTAQPVIRPPGGGPGMRGPSFLQSLIPIFKQIERFTKSLGPSLGDLFRASLPFLQMFVKSLEQATKILLPVFAQSLKDMAPFLPMLAAGLLNIVQGLAGMIKAMGPGGMKASAEIFIGLCRAMEFILIGVGHAADWLAKAIMISAHAIVVAWHWLIPAFEDFRHRTAVIFDGVRHDIGHIWDLIFENSIGMVIRLAHNVEAVLNGLSRAAGSAWNILWKNTVSATVNGINIVVSWFRKLPGRILGALFGLGHSLYGFAHAALSEFWSGLKAVGGSILSWVGNFISNIVGDIKKLLHIGSPSAVFFDIGKNMMLGLFHGIKAHAHQAASAARGAIGGVSGALGGDALANQALARRIFPWPASQWQPFVELVMAESGFNRFARNPSSGAYGIAQALPPTKYPFAGQAAGGSHAGAQLSWMFNYIAQRYGTPAGAWAHELSAHWYGGGLRGGLFTSPTLIGVGERGPERVDVTPAGQGRGGALLNIENYNSYTGTDEQLLMQKFNFAVYAAGLGS